MHKEYNQSNECIKSRESSQPYKCDCDAGTNAYCTCTRTSCGTSANGSTSTGHTSFPCAHCRDHDPSTSSSTSKCAISASRECNTIADYIERDYANYITATNSSRENSCSGVWVSDEPRNFKQANANSTEPIERCTGIPTGVTI